MKTLKSLPARLMLGIVAGILAGLALPEQAMVIIVTLKYIMSQLITFCVPLIIIGFIAPSITRLGNSATRMLVVAVVIAYVSSILAAFMSCLAGFGIIPHLKIVSDPESLRELPAVAFQLDIPQIMPVMSALVFSTLLGLAAVWTRAKTITAVLDEFQVIVLEIVKKSSSPYFPFLSALHFAASWKDRRCPQQRRRNSGSGWIRGFGSISATRTVRL